LIPLFSHFSSTSPVLSMGPFHIFVTYTQPPFLCLFTDIIFSPFHLNLSFTAGFPPFSFPLFFSSPPCDPPGVLDLLLRPISPHVFRQIYVKTPCFHTIIGVESFLWCNPPPFRALLFTNLAPVAVCCYSNIPLAFYCLYSNKPSPSIIKTYIPFHQYSIASTQTCAPPV